MIKDNNFSKYLLYAIGEILLVIIGILMALQINNWNEQRKLANERTKESLKGKVIKKMSNKKADRTTRGYK